MIVITQIWLSIRIDRYGFEGLEVVLIVFCTILVAGGGYLINALYDIKRDAINGKSVESTIRYKKEYWLLYYCMQFLALLFSIGVGVVFSIFILFSMSLLWYYSHSLKKQNGYLANLLVAFLIGAHTVGIWLVQTQRVSLLIYFILVFFVHWSRELVKDLEDIKGDLALDVQTVPIVWGTLLTKKICYLIIFFAVVLTVCLSWGIGYIGLQCFMIVPFGLWFWTLWILKRAKSKKQYGLVSHRLKVIMVVGLLGLELI